jgi:predicted metal-dependent HD superfamily phosphohydrolase
MAIREEFISSLQHYTSDPKIQQSMWSEIDTSYSKSNRHYHNLNHLNVLLHELTPMQREFNDWDTVIFAIVYHDAIYNTLNQNNEEKSAALAVKRLTSLGLTAEQTTACEKLILATKKHEPADRETNLFTDADLSILGSDPVTYHEYTKQIRKEYSIYPDFMYNPGRKKVLEHFLNMAHIYKSSEFAGKYEQQARKNIQTELNELC